MKRKTTKPTTPTTQPKAGKYDTQAEKVLNLLIAKLEAGVNSWRKPWDCKGNPTDNADFFAVNLFTGKPYTGINAQSLPAGLYAGFSQITSHGGKVKKGNNAYPVAWFGSFEKDLEDEQEQQKIWEQFDANKAKLTIGKYGACYQIRIGFYGVYNVYLDENCDLEKVTCICKVMKFESVFRVEDTEGLEKYLDAWKKNHKPSTTEKPFNEIEAGDLWIEAYIKAANLKGFFYDGGNRSYYVPSLDEIHVSKRTNYHTPADFYSTAFHEMTHSTGHASRLSRVGITNSDGFGGDRYAKEELIAEMGASMAMGFLGIETSGTLDNSAAYLASWLHQKVNEKASKKALETLMAASSSAKFAFAYIAEMYEAAKARKEQENKQKKQEEPAPLPMLPAIIAPTAATASAAVFKAEPRETKEPTIKERFLFCENANSITLYDTQENAEIWKLFLDTCEELEDPKAWDKLPKEVKEQAKRWAKHYRDAKWDKLQAANLIFLPKQYDAEAYGAELVSTLQGNDLIRIKQKNGTYVDYNLVSFLKRFYIIDAAHAHYRAFPNGEGCGVTTKKTYTICYYYGKEGRIEEREDKDFASIEEAEAYAESLNKKIESADALAGDYYYVSSMTAPASVAMPAFEEFWLIVDGETAIRVREGDGTNLSTEDQEEGYVDYIYYDTFNVCDGLNIAERSENDDTSDGGMILLKSSYVAHTSLEIAEIVAEFVGCKDADWKYQKEVPTFEEPDPEHYNDGMIDLRNIQEFCRVVFTNCAGDTKVIGYDNNFFAPCDLLEAYKSLWREDWNMDNEKELYIKKFKEYLIATGCSAEELEDND